MTVQNYIDEFISECLLPTTGVKEVVQNKQLYSWYEQWSEHAELPTLTRNAFGRGLAKRFQRTRRHGLIYYYCKLNPKMAD